MQEKCFDASPRLTSIRLLDSGGRPQKKGMEDGDAKMGLSATKNFLDTHRSTSGMGGIAAEPIKARFDKFDRVCKQIGRSESLTDCECQVSKRLKHQAVRVRTEKNGTKNARIYFSYKQPRA